MNQPTELVKAHEDALKALYKYKQVCERNGLWAVHKTLSTAISHIDGWTTEVLGGAQ